MVQYDRSVIQEFAQRLYRRAKTTIIVSTLIGLIAGGGFGYFLAESIRGSSTAILVTICAGVVGAIGYYIGVERSFKLRLLAQTALCQVMIESNTSAGVARPAAASVSTRPVAAPASPVMAVAAR